MDGGVTYWDTTREEWISNDDPLLDLKDPSSVTVAVTSPAKPDGNQLEFPENWSEYMAFNPSRLQTTVEKGNIFDDNTVAKALSPSLLRRIQRRNARAGNTMCQIDILNTVETTLTHEASLSLSYPPFSCVELALMTLCVTVDPSREMWSLRRLA